MGKKSRWHGPRAMGPPAPPPPRRGPGPPPRPGETVQAPVIGLGQELRERAGLSPSRLEALLAQNGGAAGLSRALGALAAQGGIPFPYKGPFLPPASALFENLRTREYVRLVQDRRGLDTGLRGDELSPFAAWRAKGVPTTLEVSEEAYGAVDQLTDHFTEIPRMACHVRGHPSPLEAWGDPLLAAAAVQIAVDGALRAGTALDPPALREGCWAAFREATNFKITLAAAIYRFFGASAVLDMCGGWGDRALAAAGAGSVLRYVGVDPSPALVRGHGALSAFLEAEGCACQTRFCSVPFELYDSARCSEDFRDVPGGRPDFVFASPPYYNWELYGDDPGQSFRGQSLAKWLRGWLFPAMDLAWRHLAPGGHLAVYLSDAGGIKMTGPLHGHMEARGRPFAGVLQCCRGKKRSLPLWVWQKEAGGPEAAGETPENARPGAE